VTLKTNYFLLLKWPKVEAMLIILLSWVGEYIVVICVPEWFLASGNRCSQLDGLVIAQSMILVGILTSILSKIMNKDVAKWSGIFSSVFNAHATHTWFNGSEKVVGPTNGCPVLII